MSDPSGPGIVNLVEIRLILDRIDPPAGRLWVTASAGLARDGEPEICFTGWLGLLRALYLITAAGQTIGECGQRGSASRSAAMPGTGRR
jgi:hypothetical protein